MKFYCPSVSFHPTPLTSQNFEQAQPNLTNVKMWSILEGGILKGEVQLRDIEFVDGRPQGLFKADP